MKEIHVVRTQALLAEGALTPSVRKYESGVNEQVRLAEAKKIVVDNLDGTALDAGKTVMRKTLQDERIRQWEAGEGKVEGYSDDLFFGGSQVVLKGSVDATLRSLSEHWDVSTKVLKAVLMLLQTAVSPSSPGVD